MEHREWFLFSVHGLVLVALLRYGDLTVAQMAARVGRTKWTVLRVLRDLRQARLLTVERVGRRNTYRVNLDAHFRSPLMLDQKISALLDVFGDLSGDRRLIAKGGADSQ